MIALDQRTASTGELGVRTGCFVIYLLVVGIVSAGAVPLPRPRPPALAPAALDPEEPSGAPSACRLRLSADIARAPSIAPLSGPGECAVEDVVRLEAIVLAD